MTHTPITYTRRKCQHVQLVVTRTDKKKTHTHTHTCFPNQNSGRPRERSIALANTHKTLERLSKDTRKTHWKDARTILERHRFLPRKVRWCETRGGSTSSCLCLDVVYVPTCSSASRAKFVHQASAVAGKACSSCRVRPHSARQYRCAHFFTNLTSSVCSTYLFTIPIRFTVN